MAYRLVKIPSYDKVKKGDTVAYREEKARSNTMLKITGWDRMKSRWNAHSKRIGDTFLTKADFTKGRVHWRKVRKKKKATSSTNK